MDGMDGMDKHRHSRTNTDDVSQISYLRFEKKDGTLKCELQTMLGSSDPVGY